MATGLGLKLPLNLQHINVADETINLTTYAQRLRLQENHLTNPA